MIFSIEEASRRGDWTRFSTPRTTPSGVLIPTVVEPSYGSRISAATFYVFPVNHTLMASMAYSTITR